MAVQLSKTELENIASFRYKTNGLTPLEIYIFDPFWTYLANNCCPNWLAPNAMTLAGLIVPILSFVAICIENPAFDKVTPWWCPALCCAAYFWYQTLDAIDGKQARRTDNCSPLGQLLDHNLDQISFTIFMINVCSLLSIEHDIIRIMLIVPGVMAAHYSIEYRTHFTKFHATVVGFIGATEQICIQMFFTLWCIHACNQKQTLKEIEFTFQDYTVNLSDIVIAFSALSGIHWTTENFVRGFIAAKDKIYAIGCLVPYIQFLGMLYCSKYSRFFKSCPLAFIAMNGLYLTYVTGYFNLNSTASTTFDCFYFWPFWYMGALYIDNQQLLNDQQVKIMFGLYTAWLLKSYIAFMTSVVTQLCNHMNLSFLRVKDPKQRLFSKSKAV